MAVITLHDPDAIEAVLRRNPALHLYEIGDLDDGYWPFTVWYGLVERAEIRATLLVYTATDPPTLIALADPPATDLYELLRQVRRLLPSQLYAHLSPGGLAALGSDVTAFSKGKHLKMALADLTADVPGVADTVRLTSADLDDLLRLYGVGYRGNWFSPEMLDGGPYFGRRVNGELVSAAGVHVYAPALGVAALGNIVTHPAHRGRGYAAAVTARVCQTLLPTVSLIGLNVKASNAAAVACYTRLGFRPIAEYEEVAVTV
jgi:ribosomal protein S18 acetylase RimI-like enzyme